MPGKWDTTKKADQEAVKRSRMLPTKKGESIYGKRRQGPKTHFDVSGKPRCQLGLDAVDRACQLTDVREDVSCKSCLAHLNGEHAGTIRKALSGTKYRKIHGFAASRGNAV